MFRFFSTVILCFCLFVTAPNNFSIVEMFSFPSVFAQEETGESTQENTQEKTEENSKEQTENSSEEKSDATKQAESEFSGGDITTEASAQFVAKNVDDKAMLSMLVLFAVAVVAMGMLKCRRAGMQMDVLVYVAGAIAFIAGEVKAYASHNIATEEVALDYDPTSLTNEQRASLEKQRGIYENGVEAAKMKATLQMAAAAAFTLAAALAIYRWVKVKGVLGGCKTKNMAAAKGCPAPEKAVPACTKINAEITKMETICATPGKSACAAEEQTRSACEQQCPPPVNVAVGAGATTVAPTTKTATETFKNCTIICGAEICTPANLGQVYPEKLQDVFNTLDEAKLASYEPEVNDEAIDSFGNFLSESAKTIFLSLFPQAKAASDNKDNKSHKSANMQRLFGFGAIGLGVVLGLIPKFGATFAKFVYCPPGRAIIYTVTAALAWAAWAQSNSSKKKMEKYIKEIDAILDALPDTDASIGKNSGGDTSPTATATATGTATPTATPTSSYGSVVGGIYVPGKDYPTASVYSGQAVCARDANGNCVSLAKTAESIKKSSFNDSTMSLGDLGKEFGDLVDSAVRIGDSLQSSTDLTPAIMKDIEAFNSKNAAIKAFFDNAQENLNKVDGKNALNIKEEANKAGAEFMKTASSYIASQGASLSDIAKEMGLSFDSQSPSLDDYSSSFSDFFSPSSYSSGSSSSGSYLLDNEASTPSFDFETSKAHEYTGTYKASFEEEVNKKSGVTIFEIVSQRYLKTAMRRLEMIISQD